MGIALERACQVTFSQQQLLVLPAQTRSIATQYRRAQAALVLAGSSTSLGPT